MNVSSSFEDGFHAGRIQEKITEHDRRLNAINGSIDRAELAISGLREDVRAIGVKVGVYAAVAAFVSGIVGSLITAVLAIKLTQ